MNSQAAMLDSNENCSCWHQSWGNVSRGFEAFPHQGLLQWNTQIVLAAFTSAVAFVVARGQYRKMAGILFQCALSKQRLIPKAKQQVLV